MTRRRLRRDGLVLVALAALTTALYHRALMFWPFSDGWALISLGRRPWLEAAATQLSYHWIPVTNLFVGALWRAFGTCGACYQWLNLAELAMVAWMLFRLGSRLWRETLTPALAAGLLIASAAFYDLPLWPVVGNFQSLAALLYLAGLLAALPRDESRKAWTWGIAFGLFSLAAFLTYEPTVSMLPVGCLLALLLRPTGTWRERLRSAWPVLASAGGALLLVAATKIYAVATGHVAAHPPTTFLAVVTRVYYLERAVLAAFSLRGNGDTLHLIFSLGTNTGLTPLFYTLVVAWLVAAAAAVVVACRIGRPAVRFTVAWMACHLVITSLGATIVPRHLYLVALPSSLLLSHVLLRASAWTMARLRRGRPPSGSLASLAATALLALLLAAGAQRDRRQALPLYAAAAGATRDTYRSVAARVRQQPPLERVLLVNVAATAGRAGIGLSFGAALERVAELGAAGRPVQVTIVHTTTAFRPVSPSIAASCDEVRSRAADPRTLTLAFDTDTLQMRRIGPGEAASGCSPAAGAAPP